MGQALKFPKGSIVAIDKGYIDYAWHKSLTDNGIFFSPSAARNAIHQVASRRSLLKDKGLQHVTLTTAKFIRKRNLMALLRADPPPDDSVNLNQMVFL